MAPVMKLVSARALFVQLVAAATQRNITMKNRSRATGTASAFVNFLTEAIERVGQMKNSYKKTAPDCECIATHRKKGERLKWSKSNAFYLPTTANKATFFVHNHS